MTPVSSVFPVLAMSLIATQSAAQEFSIDAASPEVPARSAADIYVVDGSAPALTHANLGLAPGDEVDAFSYGQDKLDPLGPNFYVSLYYSVDRSTNGLQGDGRPGAGAIRAQVGGNGAAGDTFFAKVIWAGPQIGMFPISRGLFIDAPDRLLTPLPSTQSDIDGLSIFEANLETPVYISVPSGGVQGQTWGPADIIRMIPGDPPNTQPVAQIWATAAQLGLSANDNIDALAIANRGGDTFDFGDIVYVSLDRGSPGRLYSLGEEAVLQVSPGPPIVVFDHSVLNLEEADELNAMTGFDPGPGIWEDPPPWIEERKGNGGVQKN